MPVSNHRRQCLNDLPGHARPSCRSCGHPIGHGIRVDRVGWQCLACDRRARTLAVASAALLSAGCGDITIQVGGCPCPPIPAARTVSEPVLLVPSAVEGDPLPALERTPLPPPASETRSTIHPDYRDAH